MSRAPAPPRGGAVDPRLAAVFHAGVAHLQAGRHGEACALLAQAAAAAPAVGDVRRAFAEALLGAGELARAEAEAQAAVAADRRAPAPWLTLGLVLRQAGRLDAAEAAWRRALALDRRFASAAVRLNGLLLERGRAREAAQVTAALAAAPAAEPGVLGAHADALKAQGRAEEALALYGRVVAADPADAAAEHNLAAALADLRRDDEALAAVDRARAKGSDAAETWLVRAHALQGLGRYDEAEAAYRHAVRRRPGLRDAVVDLARLVWMRTADVAAAAAVYEEAVAAGAPAPALLVEKARLFDYAGDRRAALAALAPLVRDAHAPRAHAAAAQIAVHLDPELAARHAETALAARPDDARLQLTLAEARLAQGRAEDASALAARVLAASRHDQHALAVQATAWRMLGDPRYGALYDYAAFVRAFTLETPAGWPDLAAFLADLAAALGGLHGLRTHPVGQSLREGTQTHANLQRATDPAIVAFRQALDAPIRAYAAALGEGRDPVRARAGRDWRLSGLWSVRLQPGGRHVDHIHPEGWLSSAFYVQLPPAVAAGGREGWIKFGEPGPPVGGPPLPAEHWVKPEPGRLVLFPSYMWHGTAPFGGTEPRLTLAFDVVPA